MERGIVSAGRDPKTGRNLRPRLELTRLALPRRVYTQAHMDHVIEGLAPIVAERERLRGMRIVDEPPFLRHFTARFEPRS